MRNMSNFKVPNPSITSRHLILNQFQSPLGL